MENIRKPGSPETVEELAKQVRVSRPSAEEAAELEGATLSPRRGLQASPEDPGESAPLQATQEPEKPAEDPLDDDNEVDADDPAQLPQWAREAIPANLKIPPGRTITVMRFRAEWTDRKDKGKDRTCVLWNLSVGDERLANQRGGDNVFMNTNEQAKQMIRAIDGLLADYSGRQGPANIDTFWNEIGKKCRGLVINHFIRAHSLTDAEKMDFLQRCLVLRTSYLARSTQTE